VIDLKPCPFCGGKAYLARLGNDHTHIKRTIEVGCEPCGIRQRSSVIRQTLDWQEPRSIEKWNTRAPVLVMRVSEIDDAMVERAAMALTGARWDNGHKLVSGETLSAREMAATEARAAITAALTSTTSTEG
jgi:Lar family restriction alleviation protein